MPSYQHVRELIDRTVVIHPAQPQALTLGLPLTSWTYRSCTTSTQGSCPTWPTRHQLVPTCTSLLPLPLLPLLLALRPLPLPLGAPAEASLLLYQLPHQQPVRWPASKQGTDPDLEIGSSTAADGTLLRDLLPPPPGGDLVVLMPPTAAA